VENKKDRGAVEVVMNTKELYKFLDKHSERQEKEDK